MTETIDANNTAGRQSLSFGAIGFLVALEFMLLLVSWIFFGIDFWIPLQFGVIVGWMITQARSVTAAMIVGNAALGMAFSFYLVGFVLWPSTILGFIAVVIMALHLTSFGKPDGGSNNSGDANPIAFIVAIIAGRAYLATSYTTITGIESFSNNFLNWLTVFVVGIVPGWPVIANIISAALLNGTLIVYLVLLLKRIANPIAN